MNRLVCNFVVLIYLLSPLSVAANEVKKGKVVVSQFSEFTEITEHVAEFSSWPELKQYLADNLASKPEDTLKAIVQFHKTLPQLTPEQLSSFNLHWANNEKVLGQIEAASKKLSLVTPELLSEAEQLEYFVAKGQLLLVKHQLFEAAGAWRAAYDKSQSLGKINLSNDVSLQLAELYYELNAQKQAELWLQKVQFDISDNTDLATLIETSVKLAQLQTKLSLFVEAEQTLKNTIDYLATKNLVAIQSALRFQLAEVYHSWQKFDLVRALYEQAFVAGQKSRDVNQQMKALVGLMELDLQTESPWQANKTLVQADKLEAYLFDRETRLAFWQTKAKVLAAKGSYYSALAVLAKYEQALNMDKQELEWLEMLDDKLMWQLKSGQTSSVQDTFKAYQNLSNKVSQLDTSSKISFLQQSREFDRQQTLVDKQQALEQLQALEFANETSSNRVTALYIVIVLLMGAAAVSLYWLYRKFNYEKDQDSLVDPVSGAYNHRFLSRQFDYLKYKKHGVSLVMFDIDRMADINAKLGHELADHLLYKVVQRLKNRLFKNTWLIRTSADRFVVLANNFDRKQVFILAEILRKELNSSDFKIHKHKVKLRASFAALECLPEQDLEAIKHKLQLTVSQAKLQGGDKTCA